MPAQKLYVKLFLLNKFEIQINCTEKEKYVRHLPISDAALPVGAQIRIFGLLKSSPSLARMFIAL